MARRVVVSAVASRGGSESQRPSPRRIQSALASERRLRETNIEAWKRTVSSSARISSYCRPKLCFAPCTRQLSSTTYRTHVIMTVGGLTS
jgi:hypothetical protein